MKVNTHSLVTLVCFSNMITVFFSNCKLKFVTVTEFVYIDRSFKNFSNSCKMEVNSVNCLFCAQPCSPDFVINQRKTVSSPLAFGGADEMIEEHLKAIFILRKVLKIPQEILCQFLGKGNGQFYPELWFNVCESCGESVTQFYAVLKQISKLERRLTTIQTELKGRIEDSRTVDNEDLIWTKIREEALKDHLPQGITDVKRETEPIIVNETHNQTECMSEWHDDDDCNEDTQSHFHLQNDMTFNDNPSDDVDFDDKEEIKFVTDFNPLDFQLPQRNHSISNTCFGPKIRTYFYICQQCSFQSNTKGKFEAHQKLHEEGSRAISCHECGRPVLPEQLERHRAKHSSMGYYQRQQSTLTGEEIPDMSTSTTSQSSGKYYYQCSSCPFESNSRVRFGIHSKLHEEGSEAISCTECGFYVDPKKMTRHRAVRHKRKLGKHKANRTAKEKLL